MRTNPKIKVYGRKSSKKKKPENVDITTFSGTLNDGLDKSRTCDPHLVEVVLSQLSYKTVIRYKNNLFLYIIIACKMEEVHRKLLNFTFYVIFKRNVRAFLLLTNVFSFYRLLVIVPYLLFFLRLHGRNICYLQFG